MGLIAPQITSDDASKAMLDGLTRMIRDRLRERIMERIKPDVDAAVEAGLAEFKATVESYRDPMQMRDTVRVLIERKTTEHS